MSLISGTITNKKGNPMEGVYVSLKDSEFEDMFSTLTNENGEYFLEAADGYYPHMYAVREYAENYLEFWCQNINLYENTVINASIDKLEIYGLHCFRIKGGYPALTIYFRPMSLVKQKAGQSNICPDITKDCIKISINGDESKILHLNKVEEYVGNSCVYAYLLQASIPDKLLPRDKNLLDVQIEDLDGFFGQASLFF